MYVIYVCMYVCMLCFLQFIFIPVSFKWVKLLIETGHLVFHMYSHSRLLTLYINILKIVRKCAIAKHIKQPILLTWQRIYVSLHYTYVHEMKAYKITFYLRFLYKYRKTHSLLTNEHWGG